MAIYKGFTELIGKTPLVEVVNIEQRYDLEAKVLVKLEYCNPAGSVKDRTAYYMIKEAEKKGILKEGSVIIEPTSGNTGIGLAAIAATNSVAGITKPVFISPCLAFLICAFNVKPSSISKTSFGLLSCSCLIVFAYSIAVFRLSAYDGMDTSCSF